MGASGPMLERSIVTAAEIASALSWWAEAGVDSLVDEQPRVWTAPAAVLAPKADIPLPASPEKAMVVAPSLPDFPSSVDALADWYLAAPLPGVGPRAQRLAPAGDSRARLMVLVDMPEPDDLTAAMLLAGEAGALFDKMLGAIGQSRDTIWFASMYPGRIPGGAIPPESIDLITQITRKHVELIRPAKLWLLGRAASCAILGMDEVQARGRLHKFNHNGTTTDVIASVHPRVLLQTPKRKAEVWADMQRLIED